MGFFSGLASIAGGLINGSESNAGSEFLQGQVGFDPKDASGFGGGVTFDDQGQGTFAGDAGTQAFGQQLQQGGINQLQGGLFNNQGFQQAFGQNDIAGSLGQAQGALQQQTNPFFNQGGFQQNAGNVNALGNQFAQQTAAGPQDFSGGLQQNLFAQGSANQTNAGNQGALFNQSLNSQRAAAQPQQDRNFNKLQDRLFATGQLGSTGGSQQLEGLFNSFNQQDLGFQNNAFGQAQQQQNFLANLGGQQIQQGQGFLGQNLGQFNQGAANAANFAGLGAQFEGQGFGQNLAATQQNQSAGNQRLQNAMGLFGQGSDVFNQNFGQGIQAQQANLSQNQFGLDSILGLMNSENNRIGAVGQSAQGISQTNPSGRGDLAAGIIEGIGSFF